MRGVNVVGIFMTSRTKMIFELKYASKGNAESKFFYKIRWLDLSMSGKGLMLRLQIWLRMLVNYPGTNYPHLSFWPRWTFSSLLKNIGRLAGKPPGLFYPLWSGHNLCYFTGDIGFIFRWYISSQARDLVGLKWS